MICPKTFLPLTFIWSLVSSVACQTEHKAQSKNGDKVAIVLPQPTKLVRSGQGFSQSSFSVEIDLSSGKMLYRQILGKDSGCEGEAQLEQELNTILTSIQQLELCVGENSQPISDGYIEQLRLYYPAGSFLPQSLQVSEEDGLKVVSVLEKYNEAVFGKQQYACAGKFALDALLKSKVSCLSFDE